MEGKGGDGKLTLLSLAAAEVGEQIQAALEARQRADWRLFAYAASSSLDAHHVEHTIGEVSEVQLVRWPPH